MEKVVVLMSTYNGEKYIRTQIDSIMNQKNCMLTLLVRDDGSTDQTKEILNEYQEKEQLTWYTGDNLRPPCSFMNLVFHAPDADYYAFADQDDIWDEDKISCAMKKLKKADGPAFYHSNARLADSQGRPTGVLLHKKDPKLNFYSLTCAGGILGCTMVFNRELRQEMIKTAFPKRIRMHDYYVGMVGLGIGGTAIYDNDPHINYRQHGGNVLGVAVGFKAKIKSKLKQFAKQEKYSISEQAQEILDYYGDRLIPEYAKQLKTITLYKTTIWRTAGVAFSPRAHYSSFKNSIFIRICLLFRRR